MKRREQRKLTTFIMALLMIISSLPFKFYGGIVMEAFAGDNTAVAASTASGTTTDGTGTDGHYTVGNSTYTYSVIDGNTVGIGKYSGTDTEIVIPDEIDGKKVTRIGYSAFSGCSSLTSITIPEGVTSIGNIAFKGCSSLTSITIPEGVTSIEYNTFEDCSGLTSISVASGNEKYKSIEGVLFSKDGKELIVYPSNKEGTEYVIPEGVTSIGRSAFAHCSSLISVTIPEGVTSIGYAAFYDCRRMTSITILEGVMSIGVGAFYDCSSLTSITIPEGVTSIEGYAFYGCSSLTSIAMPEGVTSIGNFAFNDCSSLTSITIPEGVTSIGGGAFYDCSSLKNMTVPKNVSEIGFNALGYYHMGSRYIKYDDFTISGYTNTAAEDYAQKRGFKFIELKNTESSEGIQIEYPKEDVADGGDITLVTEKLASEDNGYRDIVANIKDKILSEGIKPENVKFAAFDIVLKNDKGIAIQPKGKVTVKIPVPEGYTGAKCRIYYVNKKGEFVDMAAAYVGGYMVFETNHFSTYMVTETELESVEDVAVIFADANSDGTVNSKDVVMMKKHLAGYTVSINLAACDVNADGKFDSKDVVKTMKKLAGYDVVLGEK